MSANVSDNDVPPEPSTPGWHAHSEHPTVERYWDGQRWTENRFASGLDDAPPPPSPEALAASSSPAGAGAHEFPAAAGPASGGQGEAGSQPGVSESVAARPVRLWRTMGIAGLCAVVPLVGNSIATLLTGWASRASWLLVPGVGVAVAMVTAGIEAYGSSAGAQQLAKDAGQGLQGPTQHRPARRKTSLAFALIVAVLVFGFGGFLVSEGTRHVVLEARATIRDSKPGPSERPPQATKSPPRAVAPPPAPARPKPKSPPPAVAPPPAPARTKPPPRAVVPPAAPARVPSDEPALELRPTTGPLGSWITVSGQGFQPRERVVISLSTYEMGDTRADARGRFSNKRVQLPSVSEFPVAGQEQIRAVGDSSIQFVSRPFDLKCPEGYQQVLRSCAPPGETGGAP